MPLLESSYLPPAAFILSHVLGIAGVLYWRSRSREGRGSPRGGRGVRWPAAFPHGARLVLPLHELWQQHGQGWTWLAGRRMWWWGPRAGGAEVLVPKFGLATHSRPTLGWERLGWGLSHWDGGCLTGDEAAFCLGASPRHVAGVLPPISCPSPSPLATSTGRTRPQSCSRRWHGLAEQLGLTLPQFPKIGLAHDRCPRRTRIRYRDVRQLRAPDEHSATSSLS